VNIVFVTREYLPSKRAGGIATYVWETARLLAAEGHNIYVISASDDIRLNEESVDDNGVVSIRLSGGDFYISTNRFVNKLITRFRSIFCFWAYRKKITKKLNALIDKKTIDIIEFAEYGNEMAHWQKNNQYGTPWIVRLHGATLLDRASGGTISSIVSPIRWCFGKLEVKSALNATAISAPSLAQADWFRKYSHCDCKIVTIPNAIRFEDWSETLPSSDNSGKVKIFSAGSIVQGKGFGDLLVACEIIRRNGVDLTLTLAGKLGRLGEKMAKLSASKEYKDWLTLIGPIQRSQLRSYYASSDIVVFPSWWEPFGLVCVEAMAAGALVVGSSSGGMTEIIENGVDGFLVPPKLPHVLADKIADIISMSWSSKMQIRIAASAKVRTRYGLNSVLEKQIDLYTNAVKVAKGPELCG
jgi:glycogen(starch) synthase